MTRDLNVMHHRPLRPLHALLLAATVSVALAGKTHAAPEIEKVEPPSWWLGSRMNPVRVMIRGSGLAGAHVESATLGLSASNVWVNPAGTCLFVDVGVSETAKPGPASLMVITPGAGTPAHFDLLQPLPPEGRFQGFSPDDVIYLIMPDRFADGDPSNDDPAVSRGLYDRAQPRYYHGGDFQGIINHLGYLKDLGVTALWINPWYDNVNHLNHREKYTHDNRLDGHGLPITDYHGYGAVDFYGVEEHFGDLAKLRELVDAAHRAGLKVIQDEVANHTGPYHPWVTNSPTPTWFNGTLEHHMANKWQTWSLTVPDAPADQRAQTLEGWFMDILPDLNQNDPECARYLIQNSLWWTGVSGLDGIRLDTLPYVPRTFWRDWRATLKAQYPNVSVVGEMFDGDPAKVSFFQGGCPRFDGVDSGIESLFDFPLYYAIRRTFADGRGTKELANVFAQDSRYNDAGRLVTFLGLHDVTRFMSEPGADTAGLKLAFTFLMTARGVPMIYYGDEIALRGGRDPDNRRDFPGGFPGDPADAFTAAGRTPEQQDVFAHVQRLLRVRAASEPLRRGRFTSLLMNDRVCAYARSTGEGTVIVALNIGPAAKTLDFKADLPGVDEQAVLRDKLGVGPDVRMRKDRLKIELPARCGAIYVVEPGAQASANVPP